MPFYVSTLTPKAVECEELDTTQSFARAASRHGRMNAATTSCPTFCGL